MRIDWAHVCRLAVPPRSTTTDKYTKAGVPLAGDTNFRGFSERFQATALNSGPAGCQYICSGAGVMRRSGETRGVH